VIVGNTHDAGLRHAGPAGVSLAVRDQPATRGTRPRSPGGSRRGRAAPGLAAGIGFGSVGLGHRRLGAAARRAVRPWFALKPTQGRVAAPAGVPRCARAGPDGAHRRRGDRAVPRAQPAGPEGTSGALPPEPDGRRTRRPAPGWWTRAALQPRAGLRIRAAHRAGPRAVPVRPGARRRATPAAAAFRIRPAPRSSPWPPPFRAPASAGPRSRTWQLDRLFQVRARAEYEGAGPRAARAGACPPSPDWGRRGRRPHRPSRSAGTPTRWAGRPGAAGANRLQRVRPGAQPGAADGGLPPAEAIGADPAPATGAHRFHPPGTTRPGQPARPRCAFGMDDGPARSGCSWPGRRFPTTGSHCARRGLAGVAAPRFPMVWPVPAGPAAPWPVRIGGGPAGGGEVAR